MVIAYHLIVTCYGFWLPNDPRGSWSEVVREWEIARFGPATKTDTRRSVAGAAHNPQARLRAKEAMRYPPVSLTGVQANLAATAFSRYAEKHETVVLAFAILPEHWHAVVLRQGKPAETVAEGIKAVMTAAWNGAGCHPLAAYSSANNGRVPTPWARNCWKVFINDDEHLHKAIRYVEDNPAKEGKPPQRWRFVRPVR